MRDLLVVVPSRGRPQNIARLAKAMAATCKGDTHLLVGLDADDPTRSEYPEGVGVEYVVRDGLRLVVRWINELSVPNTSRYRFIAHIGDDQMPRTDGWDVMLMEALEEAPFAFGDDLYPGRPTGSLCCHIAMRSEVISTLGYMGPPAISHMYVDPVWMAWGEATEIRFLEACILEHEHYSAGKSEWDETYAASNAETQHDLEAFNEYMRTDFNRDVEKLRGIPFTEAQRAEFNVRLNIPG
jgi:hypothetical protein